MRNNAFAAYRQNKLNGVAEASPAKLIALLLEEAIACCQSAAHACENGNLAAKGEAIGKALAIVDSGLLGALDMERGGAIAANLKELYEYCLRALPLANLNSDPAPMRECARLLAEIREGWRAAEAFERG